MYTSPKNGWTTSKSYLAPLSLMNQQKIVENKIKIKETFFLLEKKIIGTNFLIQYYLILFDLMTLIDVNMISAFFKAKWCQYTYQLKLSYIYQCFSLPIYTFQLYWLCNKLIAHTCNINSMNTLNILLIYRQLKINLTCYYSH